MLLIFLGRNSSLHIINQGGAHSDVQKIADGSSATCVSMSQTSATPSQAYLELSRQYVISNEVLIQVTMTTDEICKDVSVLFIPRNDTDCNHLQSCKVCIKSTFYVCEIMLDSKVCVLWIKSTPNLKDVLHRHRSLSIYV